MKRDLGTSLVLLISFSILFAACDVSVTVQEKTFDVSGKALNVRADSASTTWGSVLAGTTVKLTDTISASVKTATVNSSGTYSFSELPVGRYQISAVKSGWVFVPRTLDISGASAVLPDLLGYQPPDPQTIFIITEWQDASIDVDSHVIIDDSNTFSTAVSISVTEANHVFSGRTSYPSSVYLDRDITPTDIAAGKPAVETVRIVSNPFAGTDNTGWIKFYLDTAASGAGTLTGNSAFSIKDARATVHVMQNETWLGTYPVATETEESTIMVLKIEVKPSGGGSEFIISSPGNFGEGQYRSLQ